MWSPFVVLALAASPAGAAEVVVTLPEGWSPSDLRGPHIGFSEGGSTHTRHLQVDAEGLAHLDRLGLEWRPVEAPPSGVPEGYHSPDDMVAALEALADAHPDTVRLLHLGESLEGRPIVGVALSATEEPAVAWRILGAHHGDEPISAEVALDVATTLAETGLADLPVDGVVFVVPHVNPDGVAARTRANAASVDLNRNYAYAWSADEYQPGAAPFSEPETRAIEALTLRAPPVLSVSLHSGAANFGWVWNHTLERSPDEAHHRVLGELYAESCTTPGFWITNGASWYPTNGDTNDWSYGYWGSFDYTVEVSVDKAPPADDLPLHLEHHRAALVALFTDTPVIHGQLLDAETGLPVRGMVTRQPDGRPFRTTDDGRFAVVEVAGALELEASAPGYTSARVSGEDSGAIWLQRHGPRPGLEVWPPVVVGGSTSEVDILDAHGSLVLHPPGRPAVELGHGDGHHTVPLLGQPPGLWALTVDGHAAQVGLLVDAPDAPPIEARSLSADRLTLTFARGGAGREVWVYEGGQRIGTVSIPHSDARVDIDLSPYTRAARVDVAVHGPGGPVWVADVFDGAWTASERPPGTGSLDRGQPSMTGTACGCASAPWSPVALLWPVVLGLTRRRHP